MSSTALTGDQILQALYDTATKSLKTSGDNTVTIANFPNTQAVTGTFYPATQPVSGTFFPAVQPVSNAVVSTATITNSPVITTGTQTVVAANPNRKGLYLYNNSANSVYFTFGPTANSNTLCTMILATFAQFIMPQPIYTGVISGIRNAGTGYIVVTELT